MPAVRDELSAWQAKVRPYGRAAAEAMRAGLAVPQPSTDDAVTCVRSSQMMKELPDLVLLIAVLQDACERCVETNCLQDVVGRRLEWHKSRRRDVRTHTP